MERGELPDKRGERGEGDRWGEGRYRDIWGEGG